MARSSWNDPWRRFPESRPLPATDGLATSKRRGAMATTWWSKRFVDMLDSYGLGSRMQRGRRYARSGQVLSMEVDSGLLVAQVQGSRRKPYLVTIRAATPSQRAWKKLQDAMQSKVGFVATLLDGAVPPELEALCESAGITLFPKSWSQLDTSCNCPDWENPCKHLAAVLYVFADRLDEDPWLLFTWRGRTRDQLLEHLSSLAGDPDGHGLPTWWPLVPGHAGLDRIRWHPPADPTAPSPAHSVLARLQPLDATYADRPVVDHLMPAYEVLTATDDAATKGSATKID
jgi:hypothetical protein